MNDYFLEAFRPGQNGPIAKKAAWHTYNGVSDFGGVLVLLIHGDWICFLGNLPVSSWGEAGRD